MLLGNDVDCTNRGTVDTIIRLSLKCGNTMRLSSGMSQLNCVPSTFRGAHHTPSAADRYEDLRTAEDGIPTMDSLYDLCDTLDAFIKAATRMVCTDFLCRVPAFAPHWYSWAPPFNVDQNSRCTQHATHFGILS